ncbi:MAG TPA: hypothetical protein VF170_17055 [Planctomycetaceae bacterium]
METTRNIRLAAAGAVVALAAAGAAFGAAKLKGDGTHTGSAGPPGSFVSSGSGSSGSSGSSSVPRPWHRFGGPGGPGGPFSDHDGGLASAATYLGISRSDLLTQLRSGKTLAQVAAATSGKSAAGLVDALVADAKAQLAQAVKDGMLTQVQADRLAASVEDHVTHLVDGDFPRRPGGPPPMPSSDGDPSA